MSSKKKYLTGYVHRLEDGVLKTYAPGEEAPEWVTNPKVLTSDAVIVAGAITAETLALGAITAAKLASGEPGIEDDLVDLDGKSLKAIADELGLAKNGSLDAIRDRIRAKRAESVPDSTERDALVEKATALGFEVDDNLSEVELQALIDSKE